MINPFSEINWHPDAEDLRKFGRTVGAGMLVMSAVFLLVNMFHFKSAIPGVLLIPSLIAVAGMAVLVMAYFIRSLALPVYYIWFIAGASIGIVVSNLMLAVFFYLIFTPYSLLLRIATGRDPLKLRRDGKMISNWERSSANKPPRRYFKQY